MFVDRGVDTADIMNNEYQIKNNNGIIYTIICHSGENALLLGGNDYVVISDLTNFRKLHSWGNGMYFPHFNDKDNMIKSFVRAMDYFKCLCGYTQPYEDEI